MEIENAFLGKKEEPTATELESALGPTFKLWKDLIDWLTNEAGVNTQEWSSISPKYGWALRMKLKKRTIVYLGPCAGCFRTSFVLGDRAVAAARASGLKQSIIREIEGSRRYAEGTGVRLIIRAPRDLVAVHKLAQIKLAN